MISSNFIFFNEDPDWEELRKRCYKAEKFAISDKRTSFIYSRMALEIAIEFIFQFEGLNRRLKTLADKLNDREFSSILPNSLKQSLIFIKDNGNNAVHNKLLINHDTIVNLKKLFGFMKWFYNKYGDTDNKVEIDFDRTIITDNNTPSLSSEKLKELQSSLKEENHLILTKYSKKFKELESINKEYQRLNNQLEKENRMLSIKLKTYENSKNTNVYEIGITEQYGLIWGRVFANFRLDNKDYFAVKYFSPNEQGRATERFLISEGTFQESNLFKLFYRKHINLNKDAVLNKNYDHLELVLKFNKQRFGLPSILLKKLLVDVEEKLNPKKELANLVSYREYIVNDIIGSKCQRVFILESPHSYELKNGIPAFGQSGLVMGKELYNSSLPIGKLISDRIINEIGIINACLFPLDKRVYQSIPKQVKGYMHIKELNYTGSQFKSDVKNEIVRIDKLNTVKNLQNRIAKLLVEFDIKEIVACGLISQAYLELAFPQVENVGFKRWANVQFNEREVRIRYTHHPSPKTGKNWSI